MAVSAVNLKLITQPAAEPVTIYDLADRLRLDVGDDTRMLSGLIKGARQYVEARTGQRIVRQKWRMYFNAFADEMKLSPPMVREVQQIQYLDADGATQTLATTCYATDIAGQMVRLAYGQTWPGTRADYNAVWVDGWSGMYDETSSPISSTANVPQDIQQAIVLQVSIMLGSLSPPEQEAAERARDLLLQAYWMPTL